MGEIAEATLNGEFCEGCGEYMGDGMGFPQRCPGCRPRRNLKAEYVKKQKQTRKHHCHWPGCNAQVPPAKWGCRKHWFMLPKPIRDAIWKAFVPGQERTGTPSREYVEAAREAQAFAIRYERTALKIDPPAFESQCPPRTKS